MTLKRGVFLAVMVIAVAALATPLVSLRAIAAGSAVVAKSTSSASATRAASTPKQQQIEQQRDGSGEARAEGQGKISADTLKALGITRANNAREASAKIAEKLLNKKKSGGGEVSVQSGEPSVLNAASALSAALITTIGGRDNQFSEVTLLADWDGREDCVADRELKVNDISGSEAEIDETTTRVAISEHTIANGFNENAFYLGSSIGCLCICVGFDGFRVCLCICFP